MKRALLLALLLTGCAQIIGIDDRKLERTNEAGVDVPDTGVIVPDAGSADAELADTSVPDAGPVFVDAGGLPLATTPECVEYCTLAERLCTAQQNVQLFPEFGTCVAVCNKYPKAPATTGNTLACRMQLLRVLQSSGPNEAASTCPGAGPGGGPPPGEGTGSRCGSNCESFCTMRKATCPEREGDVNCTTKCQALLDNGLFNYKADFGGGQDTLACRIAHLSAAALWDGIEAAGMKDNRDTHCAHSGIRSDKQCDFPMGFDPDCDSYCKIMATACSGENQQYQDTAQCMAFCKQMVITPATDKVSAGSRRCLRSAAYDALEGGPNSCPRAGPAGDGCLDGRCGSYCVMAQRGCPEAFKAAFPSDSLMDCRNSCMTKPGAALNSPYAFNIDGSAGGDNLYCRLKQLTIAIGNQSPAACNAALGLAAPCQ